MRQRAGKGDGGEVVGQRGDDCLMTGSGAGLSHAGSGRAQRKLRTPLPGHYLNFTFSACEGGVEADG